MKKTMLVIALLTIALSAVFPQAGVKIPAKLQTQLAALKVKSPAEKTVKSRLIARLWTFDESGANGAAAVTALEDYKVDFYILVLKEKDRTVISRVDVLDDNALADRKMMKDLVASLSALNGARLDQVSDAITAATVYSKKIYLRIKLIAGQMVKEMEAVR